MATMAANEPYQRVATDNGVFDGALIGMAVGAGGAGAGVFGARMSYNGIDKRSERFLQGLDNKQEYVEGRINKATKNYEKKMDRKSNPNLFEKRRYANAQGEMDAMVNSVSSDIDRANRDRQSQKNMVRERSVGDVHQETINQGTLIKERFGGANSTPNYEQIRRQNPSVHQQRNEHVRFARDIDADFDAKIQGIRREGAERIKFSEARSTLGRIDDKIANRQNKVQSKYDKTMHNHNETLHNIAEQRRNYNPNTMRENHVYSKMGGWKNAAIIGASAAIGGGLGMIADGLNN